MSLGTVFQEVYNVVFFEFYDRYSFVTLREDNDCFGLYHCCSNKSTKGCN